MSSVSEHSLNKEENTPRVCIGFVKRIDSYSYHAVCHRGAGWLIRCQRYPAASFSIRIDYKSFYRFVRDKIVSGDALTRACGCSMQQASQERGEIGNPNVMSSGWTAG